MRNILFSLVVCISLVISAAIPVSAAKEEFINTPSEENIKNIDEQLKELGAPDDFISTMPLEQKLDIINSNPESLIVEKKEFYFDSNGVLQEKEPGTVAPMDTIDKEDLRLYTSRSDLGYQNGRKTYRIYLNWEWLKPTVFNYTDTVALSYNDIFKSRASNNGNYQCKSYHKNLNTNHTSTTDCGGRPADISFAGAYWHYDVKFGNAWRNYGYAQMDIETKRDDNPSGYGHIIGKYYHKIGFPGSIGVTIGYVEITANSSTGFDEAATQSTWNF